MLKAIENIYRYLGGYDMNYNEFENYGANLSKKNIIRFVLIDL